MVDKVITKVYYTGLNNPNYDNPDPEHYTVIHTPTIKIDSLPIKNINDVETILNKPHYLVFLSKNGIQAFHDNIVMKYEIDISKLSTEIWAVGAHTAELTETLLKRKVNIPKNQNSIGLVESFNKLNKKEVLLITGEEPRHEFISWLRDNKWEYQQIDLYKREIKSNKQLAKTFKDNENNLVIFTAPSTIKGFLMSIGANNLKKMKCRIISFGPSTSNEIKSYDGQIFWETKIPSAEYVISTVIQRLINEKINKV